MNRSADDKITAATERAKGKIAKFTEFSCDFGDEFLNNLFYGTLETLIDRIDNRGFCEVCRGEENNAKRYGVVHYTRDSCECVLVLTNCGIFPPARQVLDFTLRNLPAGRSHFPQTYNPDGSPSDNFTIQVDRTGHVLRACWHYLKYTRDINFIEKHFQTLARATNYIKKHYHENLQLVDSGDYNDQFDGSREPWCDLYTNCSILDGYRCMEKISRLMGKKDIAEDCMEMAEKIRAGIEENLKEKQNGPVHYLAGIKPDKEKLPFNGWVNIVPLGWYEDCDREALENAYLLNMEKTIIKWGRYVIPSGFTDDYYCGRTHLSGKVLGYFMGYMASNGRLAQLREMMDFMKEFTRRPSNIYPECWWYSRMKDQKTDEAMRESWTPYLENPSGDYTIDSGNCEQVSCWLFEFFKNVVGIKEDESELIIRPAFPFTHKKITINNYPLSNGNRISYSLFREDGKVKLNAEFSGDIKCRIQVPIPKEKNIAKIDSSFVKIQAETISQNDVKWIEAIPSTGSAGEKISLEIQFV